VTFSLAAWLSILPFLFFALSYLLDIPFRTFIASGKVDCFGNRQVPSKRRRKLKKYIRDKTSKLLIFRIRLGTFLYLLAFLCCCLMILQGIHLWDSGYNFGEAIDYNAGATGRMAVRGRGKGGILVLIFMLFRNFTPQMFIIGYGYIAIKNINVIKDFYQKFINAPKLIVALQDQLSEKEHRTPDALWQTYLIAMDKIDEQDLPFTAATLIAVEQVALCNAVFAVPEENRAEFLQLGIDAYESLLDPEYLKIYLKSEIEKLKYKNDDSLAESFGIGYKEGCAYLDEATFFNDVDYKLAIAVLKTIWIKACLSDKALEKEKANHKLYELLFPSIEEHD
tara:strand:- start:14 stop:1024 length:1011 start_codon:yes stop_codon:yes gene_type:complete